MSEPKRTYYDDGVTMEQFGPMEEMDGSFDIKFWQRQGPKAIVEAARQMVIDAYHYRNEPIDDRLRRDIERFGRQRG